MSDFPQGADWRKAADGLWYPPDTKPETSDPDVVGSAPAPPTGSSDSPANTNSDGVGRGCLITVGVIAVLVVVFSMLSSDDDDGSGSAGDRRHGAFDVCTQFVEDRLKSPGSASFRNYFQDDGEVVVTGSGDGPYTVRSSVDAQNSFGAEIRSDFVCTVNHRGDGNWRLVSLDIDE